MLDPEVEKFIAEIDANRARDEIERKRFLKRFAFMFAVFWIMLHIPAAFNITILAVLLIIDVIAGMLYGLWQVSGMIFK